MPIAYLHIGEHKTGTSSFQDFIFAQNEWLGQHGLYIPKTGQTPLGAHHPLARAISGLDVSLKKKKLLPKLAKEVKKAGKPDLLISSESMSIVMAVPELLNKYYEYFASFGYTVVAILYLRQPPQSWNSRYCQVVKNLNTADLFEEFVNGRLERLQPRKFSVWDNLLERQDPPHIIRPFNSNVRQVGISKSILQDLDVQEDPPMPDPRKNRSPSPTEVFICRRFAQVIQEQGIELTSTQRHRIIEVIQSLPITDSRSYNGITSEIAAKVDRELGEWREQIAMRIWNKSWDECYPEGRNYKLANDLELLDEQEIDWSEINQLEDQLHAEWKGISKNLLNKVSRQGHGSIFSALQKYKRQQSKKKMSSE